MPDPAVGTEPPDDVIRRALTDLAEFIGGGRVGDQMDAEVNDALAALTSLVAARDEWKTEAGRRGWPKEAASEYFQLKADYPKVVAYRDALQEGFDTAQEDRVQLHRDLKSALTERDTALRALREARSLHYEVSAAQRSQFDPETRCGECLSAWPCATERLLAVALGGAGVAEGERPCGCPPGESCDECD